VSAELPRQQDVELAVEQFGVDAHAADNDPERRTGSRHGEPSRYLNTF
jgi:hypothetical protein